MEVEDLPPGVIGFVYVLHYEDGYYYVGKKTARTYRKKHFGKKKLATITDKRLKTYEMVEKELPWRDYEGSTDNSDGHTLVSKEIIYMCTNKMSMTYLEADLQFKNKVLFDEKSLNKNILGKFYDNALEGVYIEKSKT